MSDPLIDHSAHTQGGGGAKRDSTLVTLLKVTVAAATLAMLAVVLWATLDARTSIQRTNDALAAMNNGRARDQELSSFGCQSMPPRKFQMARGTCWDFGTIGALEHQYRLQGIAQGYLTPDQYTQLSEQAYGNQIIALCQANQHLCLLPGDHVAFNSTEGGEAILLQTFAGQLANRILPEAVCPYISPADNSSCPGIEQALATNPVRWSMDQQSTLYDIAHIKHALRTYGHAMPLTVSVHTTSYYLPCNDPYVSSSAQCTDPAQRVPCPTDGNFGGAASCYQFPTEMFHMNGEFYVHHAMQLEAGHVMLLAGYNDEYTTEDGMTGALIVRNTWMDGVYSFNEFAGGTPRQRGSHSLAYFLGQISLGDERYLCPNSADPRQWYTCGGGASDNTSIVADCVGLVNGVNENAISAAALYQPYELFCRTSSAPGECHSGNDWSYYTLSTTVYTDGLRIMCFLEYNKKTRVGAQRCYSPRPWDEYSLTFGPVHELPNSEAHCGYYALPYQLLRLSQAAFQGFWVNDYHVTFTPSSYAANKAANAALDYSLVEASTHSQPPMPDFDTAYPNDLPSDALRAAARRQ